VSDTAYDATSWNGVTDVAPSKNAVRDKFESLSSGGAMEVIARSVVGVGGAATIDFTSIPATYENLRIELIGRGTAAADTVDVGLRFNGDTGANYDYSYIYANASVGHNFAAAQTSAAILVRLLAANTTSPFVGAGVFDIIGYARTSLYKSGIGMSYVPWVHNRIHGAAHWRSTAAINQVTLIPSSGDFAQDTVATLYGIKGA
jgi:hypothetical protein